MYARFARDLPRFLDERLTPETARAAVARNLEGREERLITLVRRTIFEHPASPYLPLLRFAGCERGDFEKLVRGDGAEAALARLARAGVCVTVDEFKAKTPMVRGGQTFVVDQAAFDNPLPAAHIESRTGGSRSAGTRTVYDLDFLAQNWSVHQAILMDGLEARGMPYGLWYPIMPGSGPLAVLTWTRAGNAPKKWFSPVAARDIRPPLRDRLATTGIIVFGRLLSFPWPHPEHVALEDALQVARWIHEQVSEHGGCLFNAYTSAAVRICQAAREASLDIAGARFVVAGEPLTEAKRGEIERAGVKLATYYASMDAGFLGVSCLEPEECDEVHLFEDNFVFGQHARAVPHAAATVDALLTTTLLPSTPKVLLNVETGDCGVLGRRACGCSLDRLGLATHLHTIRGFDKLTSQGMTFIGTDVVKVIEQDLPARFGGSLADYQMVEEEDERGHTRMSLVISPSVGAVDEAEAVKVVIEALSRGPDHHRMMAKIWADSGTFRVLRIQPQVTAAGKLMPLHISRRPTRHPRA